MNSINQLENIIPDSVYKRPLRRILVGFHQKPFDVFLLHVNGLVAVGVKTPAYVDQEKTVRRKCCLVEPSMLLGLKIDVRISEVGYAICYRPVDINEANDLFKIAATSRTADLCYPFTRLNGPGHCETAVSLESWNPNLSLVAELDRDEEVLRNEAIRILRKQGFSTGTIYDPACSTGTFLSKTKGAFREARVIGQDLNLGMVTLAKQKLDEIYHVDAAYPIVPKKSVDVLVCRHLNLDVVTTREAERLFIIAVETVKLHGLIIVFGHTPILLSSAWFEGIGLEVLQKVSTTSNRYALFQFYVLRRSKPDCLTDLCTWSLSSK